MERWYEERKIVESEGIILVNWYKRKWSGKLKERKIYK